MGGGGSVALGGARQAARLDWFPRLAVVVPSGEGFGDLFGRNWFLSL